METYNYLIENGFAIQDKICVFCSTILNNSDSVCLNCKEYKGVMPIAEAYEVYGKEILPL